MISEWYWEGEDLTNQNVVSILSADSFMSYTNMIENIFVGFTKTKLLRCFPLAS